MWPLTEWPFNELRREINQLLDGAGSAATGGWPWSAPGFPALNVWEDSEALHAEAEVPGVGADELEVYAVGNELTIKGRRKALQGEGLSYHRQERGTGEFTRVVTLPVEVDADKVIATLKDGVATITMPKAAEVRPRKIAVKAS